MSDQRVKIDDLAKQLKGSADERAAAAEALAQLGTDCSAACIQLVQACGTDDLTREWAVAALEEMGPPPSDVVPELMDLVENPTTNVAYWAVTLLGRSEDQAAAACDALAKLIASDRELSVRERAVWAVDKIGCKSSAVVRALTVATNSSHTRLARLASDALR